tara:strand:+ start:327 stop:743 length:417 start_codon:yes stop_codon:yes gene_type:complete
MSLTLATLATMHLVCSGHVRLGTQESFLKFGPGEWEQSELNLVVEDASVSGVPLPRGFEFHEMRAIESREQDEFRFQSQLSASNDRTTAFFLQISPESDGVRDVSWNGGELVGAHISRDVTFGDLACVEDKHAEDRKS